jgi:hypothetical protein
MLALANTTGQCLPQLRELLEGTPQVLSLQLQLSMSGPGLRQQFLQAWHAVAPATAVQSLQLVFQGSRMPGLALDPVGYRKPDEKAHSSSQLQQPYSKPSPGPACLGSAKRAALRRSHPPLLPCLAAAQVSMFLEAAPAVGRELRLPELHSLSLYVAPARWAHGVSSCFLLHSGAVGVCYAAVRLSSGGILPSLSQACSPQTPWMEALSCGLTLHAPASQDTGYIAGGLHAGRGKGRIIVSLMHRSISTHARRTVQRA